MPKLGDNFTVLVSNNASENLKVNFEDGRLLATVHSILWREVVVTTVIVPFP